MDKWLELPHLCIRYKHYILLSCIQTVVFHNFIAFLVAIDFCSQCMGKLQLTGINLTWVFNSRSGCMCAKDLCCYAAKRPNLKLKTWSKQLLGYLLLAFTLSCQCHKTFKCKLTHYFLTRSFHSTDKYFFCKIRFNWSWHV